MQDLLEHVQINSYLSTYINPNLHLMAQIGWIDFSNRDRKRAQQLMSMIRPEGQLDELGVGYLRDAIANHLFPGISTIQTRAKYFFIIPHILRDYHHLKGSEKRSVTPRQFLIDKENKVKNKFRELYNYQEGLGIIGVTLKSNQYIKRNASEIYWAGLQTFGFMNPEGYSLDQYLRNMASEQPFELSRNDNEQDDADSNDDFRSVLLTPVNKEWFYKLQLSLDEQEADFFRSQIINTGKLHPYALMPQLLYHPDLLDAFLEALNFQKFVTRSLNLSFTAPIKKLLQLAFDFAHIMEGVHLLYNHLLQHHFYKDKYDNCFNEEWMQWRSSLQDEMINFRGFEPQELFVFSQRPRPNTEYFIGQWWELIRQSKPNSAPSVAMHNLVKQKEQLSKGKKSRLSKPVSANTDIDFEKRIGLSLFQYRFANAKIIMKDILNPEINYAASTT